VTNARAGKSVTSSIAASQLARSRHAARRHLIDILTPLLSDP
jgi:hypothetical protein